jgi:iron(III) transport system ATP-binding protein
MSVFENVAFPLREMRGKFNRDEIRDKVARALKLVQLVGLQDRPAPFLSGGQQQRLALARALVREPKVLLLDEPLSNLDAKLRESTRIEVRDLVKRLGITTVYVTHDQLEALTMSDRVAVMKQGEIVQEAGPVELYQAPRERFVANFIGQSNFIEAKVSSLPSAGSEIGAAATSSGQIKCILPAGFNVGDSMLIAVRPEDITVVDGAPGSGNVVEGKVSATSFMGDSIEYQVMVAGAMMRMKLHPSTGVRQGDTIRLNLPEESCRALLP